MEGRAERFYLKNDLIGISLQDILAESADALMVTDANGRICLVGRSMIEDLHTTPQYLLGKNVDDLVKEGYYSRSTTRECINCRKRVDGVGASKDGKQFISTSKPFFDKSGEFTYVITNTRSFDVMETLVKELEESKAAAHKFEHMAAYLGNRQDSISTPIAVSSKMKHVLQLCYDVASSDSTVLLTGESGTGKEVCASYIFHHSKRADKAFLPINCGAIPYDLIEAELFGYEKGAFTGADPKGHLGLLEMADGGTLFLDEIGELPLQVQSKFLRFLESGESRRIGGHKYIQTDVRVIAATNRDLLKMVRGHKFREDLYYRLNVLPIRIPPLRERREDILPLTLYFLEKFNRKYQKAVIFTPKLQEQLMGYDYPGNIRELRNILERTVVTDNNSREFAEHESRTSASFSPGAQISPLKQAMRDYELAYITRAIESCGGNITKAAQMLGIHRTMIYKKLESFKHMEA